MSDEEFVSWRQACLMAGAFLVVALVILVILAGLAWVLLGLAL